MKYFLRYLGSSVNTTLLHNLRVKITETLHLHGVHFEKPLKTIWIPTVIPLLKIKDGYRLLFCKSGLNSRTTLFTRSGEGKASLFPSQVERVSKT